MSDSAQVSIIVPALNEGPNLAPLAERIDAVLRGRAGGYEVIVVDDNSRDDSRAIAAELGQRFPFRMIVRDDPKDGLSGAVLCGIAEARGEYLVVMDADLQHPPEKLPDLLDPLERGKSEFVLGSRYVPGGSTGEQWGFFRKINSSVATFLARPFAGRTTDPMSGFFAMKRSTYDRAQRLTPLGYKIGLELMCKCRVRDVREIPIHFAERTRGQSKLTLKQQFRYLEHLSRLYDFTFPRASPVVKFAVVQAVGWLAGLGIFVVLLKAGLRPVGVVTLAYCAALVVTALFHLRYVRTQREFLARPNPWTDFVLIAAAELLACTLMATWVVWRVDRHTQFDLFVIPFTVGTFVRYVLRKELLQDVRGL
ncbi:MAG: glycosyltransferase, partial [Tepidisphaeraceae bacterium]